MLKLVGPENSQGAVSAEADALFKQYIIMEAAGIHELAGNQAERVVPLAGAAICVE